MSGRPLYFVVMVPGGVKTIKTRREMRRDEDPRLKPVKHAHRRVSALTFDVDRGTTMSTAAMSCKQEGS